MNPNSDAAFKVLKNVVKTSVLLENCDNDLGELLCKVIKLLLEGGLDLLSGDHGLVDLANCGGGSSANDNTPGLA